MDNFNDSLEVCFKDNKKVLNSKITISYKNNKVIIEPLFVEAYRFEDEGYGNYRDYSINKTEDNIYGVNAQRNRKDKLYFHPKYNHQYSSGLDLVLSNNKHIAYSILIKFAIVYLANSKEKYFCSMMFVPLVMFELLKYDGDINEFISIVNSENKNVIKNLDILVNYNQSDDEGIKCMRANTSKGCPEQLGLYKKSFGLNHNCAHAYSVFCDKIKKITKQENCVYVNKRHELVKKYFIN